MLHDPRLVISANCLRRADFETRVRAAARAGFTGIGLRVSDYVSATTREGLSPDDLLPILQNHGIEIYEVEAAWDWATGGSLEHTQYIELLEQMRETLNFKQFNAFIFDDVTLDAILGGYRELCDVLPDIPVGLEHIGYGPIVTLGEAVLLVRKADRPNAKVILDSWHFKRTSSAESDIETLSPSEVCSIQISDVLEQPNVDMAHEARHERQLPEVGSSDITAWLARILDQGIRCPISIEVVNDDLDTVEPYALADLHFRALSRTIASAMTTKSHRVSL